MSIAAIESSFTSVIDNHIKCLGKRFDDSLKDMRNVRNIKTQLKDWINKINKSRLLGKYKAWTYQHVIRPRRMWLLLIYDVSLTTAEERCEWES